MVMMHFNCDEAWKYLLDNGEVYTLRGASSQISQVPIFVVLKRGGKFTGHSAMRRLIRIYQPDELEGISLYFVVRSGLKTREAWLAKARELSGEQPFWRLFHVFNLVPWKRKSRRRLPRLPSVVGGLGERP